jgi:hypothetical protein
MANSQIDAEILDLAPDFLSHLQTAFSWAQHQPSQHDT